jgi:hypothetical protein
MPEEFIVDEFNIVTTGTTIRLDLYADFGSSVIGNSADYFIIIKEQ